MNLTEQQQLLKNENIRKELAFAVDDLLVLGGPTPRVRSRAMSALVHNDTLGYSNEDEALVEGCCIGCTTIKYDGVYVRSDGSKHKVWRCTDCARFFAPVSDIVRKARGG